LAKAKGTTLLSLVKFLRSQRERAKALLPEPLHHYLDARVQPSSWYPEADLLALLRAMLELVPGDRRLNLERMGAAIAREHLEGVYAHLRTDRTDTLVRRSVTLWASQHDSGNFCAAIEGPGRARYELRNFALPSREMCSIFTAYFTEALRVAGWASVRSEKESCVIDGDEACTWSVTWTPAPETPLKPG
jgi:hypothetical protein